MKAIFYLEPGNKLLPQLWRKTDCERLQEKEMANDLWDNNVLFTASIALLQMWKAAHRAS